MKFFYEGNKVCVQKGDLAFLATNFDLPIPASIFATTFTEEANVVDQTNRFDFVLFSKEHEIQFFNSKELGFIIDWKDYKDLSIREIKKEFKKIVTEIKELEAKYKKMTSNLTRESIAVEHRLLCYKKNQVQHTYLIKKKRLRFNFPKL